MKRIPAARQTASVPPTVVAPIAPCTAAAARSRGPTLRAAASNRAELVLGRARRRRARRARRSSPARRPPRARAAPTRARPRRPRRAGSRARRASSRARRPAPPPPSASATSSRTSSARSRHRPELRDAARRRREAELGAADEEAGGERVARAGRVDDVGRQRRAHSRPSTTIPSAPRLSTQRRPSSSPSASHSRLVREHDVRRERREPRRAAAGPSRRSASTTRGRRSRAPPCAARARAACGAAPAIGSRSRRSRRGAAQSHPRTSGFELLGAQAPAPTPRSEAIVRPPSGSTSETTTPLRPSADRPDAPRRRARASSRARERARRRRRRACRRTAPRRRASAAHAATFAAWPPAPSRVSARRVVAGRERLRRGARPRRGAGRRACRRAPYDRLMDGEHKRGEPAPLLRARRPARRLGGDRRRAPAPAARASPRTTPAGLAAFEDAPCFRETVERERRAHG